MHDGLSWDYLPSIEKVPEELLEQRFGLRMYDRSNMMARMAHSELAADVADYGYSFVQCLLREEIV